MLSEEITKGHKLKERHQAITSQLNNATQLNERFRKDIESLKEEITLIKCTTDGDPGSDLKPTTTDERTITAISVDSKESL